jgi:hypothetical protein
MHTILEATYNELTLTAAIATKGLRPSLCDPPSALEVRRTTACGRLSVGYAPLAKGTYWRAFPLLLGGDRARLARSAVRPSVGG